MQEVPATAVMGQDWEAVPSVSREATNPSLHLLPLLLPLHTSTWNRVEVILQAWNTEE